MHKQTDKLKVQSIRQKGDTSSKKFKKHINQTILFFFPIYIEMVMWGKVKLDRFILTFVKKKTCHLGKGKFTFQPCPNK